MRRSRLDGLSLPESARAWGVHRQTAWKWLTAGHVHAEKVLGRWLVSRNEIERVKRAREGGTWTRDR